MTTSALTQHSYGIRRETQLSQDEAIQRVKAVLKEQGFGVLTEIDMAAAMMEKLNVTIEPYVILGACNPPLALRALEIDRAIGLLLPCNVVVRREPHATVVEAMDPEAALGLVQSQEMHAVAFEAKERLMKALEAL